MSNSPVARINKVDAEWGRMLKCPECNLGWSPEERQVKQERRQQERGCKYCSWVFCVLSAEPPRRSWNRGVKRQLSPDIPLAVYYMQDPEKRQKVKDFINALLASHTKMVRLYQQKKRRVEQLTSAVQSRDSLLEAYRDWWEKTLDSSSSQPPAGLTLTIS